MKAKPIPDSARLRFRYNPETGAIVWTANRFTSKIGTVATTGGHNSGYLRVTIDSKKYLAHRVAWFLHYGTQPAEIDHINQDVTDNRIANLRSVDHATNMRNLKATGIRWIYRPYVAVTSTYRGTPLYSGKSLLLAWFHRIMAERNDHPLSLRSPHGEP